MKIAIIGGGLTGLSAAHNLIKDGHHATIVEKNDTLGGLAYGFKQPDWSWHLEFAYHHYFTNDDHIIDLMHELGMSADMIITRPTTATLYKNSVYTLDSPISLLQFSPLSFPERIRTGMLLAALKLNPYWQPLEHLTAKTLIKNLGGKEGWNVIWKPLLEGKFDLYADEINAAWFWARIKKRTPMLGYIRGGFQHLIETLAERITSQGGHIHKRQTVRHVQIDNSKKRSSFTLSIDGNHARFDKVLITAPSQIACKLLPQLPESFTQQLLTIPHLWAQTLILETDVPILKGVYWLNINDRSFPFLAAVAHTNFMSPLHYGGKHLTYFGNYLPAGHPYLSYSKQKLLNTFLPFIKKLQHAPFNIHDSFLFTAPFAQPVHQKGYSNQAPAITTPINGIYLANMDSIYPWDRGTNYAVELGKSAAAHMKSAGL